MLPPRLADDESLALPTLLRRRADERPDAVFLHLVDDSDVTYGRLETAVRGWMRALVASGAERGDRVGTLLPPGIDAVAVWMAAARIGAIETPVNTALRGSILSYVLGDADPVCVVVHPDLVDRVEEVADDLERLPVLIVPGGESYAGTLPVRLPEFDAVVAVPDLDSRPHDVATIVYTSGTSGRSKGVVVPWAQEYATARWLMPVEGREGDVWYGPWAMFHVSGKVGLYSSALLDGRVVIRPGFSTTAFWDDVRRYRVTSTMLVASTVAYLVQQPPAAIDRDHTLRWVCAAPMPTDAPAFAERFGVHLSTLFNMTEVASPISTGFDEGPAGSCGRPRPGVVARLVGADGAEVATGEPGELVLRMDAAHEVMAGYWRAPEATVESWHDLWFHTGDSMRQDSDGWLYFLDRLKDTIRRGGENISSVELEAMVLEHPDVLECAAVGLPNEQGDRDVALFVVAEPGLDAAALAAWTDRVLPRYMRPSAITLREALPKTHTARVQKAELRAAEQHPDWTRPVARPIDIAASAHAQAAPEPAAQEPRRGAVG